MEIRLMNAYDTVCVLQEEGRVEVWFNCKQTQGSFGEIDMFENRIVVMTAQLCKFTKNQ